MCSTELKETQILKGRIDFSSKQGRKLAASMAYTTAYPEMHPPDADCGSQELRLLTKTGSCKDRMSKTFTSLHGWYIQERDSGIRLTRK